MFLNRLFLLFGISLLLISSAKAQNPQKPVNFVIGGALEFGGANIAMVSFVDGSKQYIKAGQGGTINAGIKWNPTPESKWFFRGIVGFKYLTTKATNANIMLTRIPLRVSANYQFAKNIWGGVGIASHQAINFNAGGIGKNASFSGNVAPTFEFGYREFSLIYTPMNYKDANNASYDASAIGIAFYVELHKKKRGL